MRAATASLDEEDEGTAEGRERLEAVLASLDEHERAALAARKREIEAERQQLDAKRSAPAFLSYLTGTQVYSKNDISKARASLPSRSGRTGRPGQSIKCSLECMICCWNASAENSLKKA